MYKSIEQAFDSLDVRQIASRKTFIDGGETHVWITSLDLDEDFHFLLSKEEQKIASKFKFYRDEQQYIVSHGILRRLLGEYLNTDGASLIFTKTEYGKPLIFDDTGKQQIHFNMTRSENTACYAFSMINEVGIDVEYINRSFDWHPIAKLYYTAEELTYLKSLEESNQVKAFYMLWTKKESILKAKGTGLSDIKKVSNQNFVKDISVFPYSQLPYQGHVTVYADASTVQFFDLGKSNKSAERQEGIE